jgi:hypothetical protein
MENVGIFSDHSEYVTPIVYILWPFGNFVVICYTFTVLVHFTKKNLATLL